MEYTFRYATVASITLRGDAATRILTRYLELSSQDTHYAAITLRWAAEPSL